MHCALAAASFLLMVLSPCAVAAFSGSSEEESN
jgi:hypothetical protein